MNRSTTATANNFLDKLNNGSIIDINDLKNFSSLLHKYSLY